MQYVVQFVGRKQGVKLLHCLAGLLMYIAIPRFSVAQIEEEIRMPQIKTVQLYMIGNQLTNPILELNTGDRMELHFDDMDADIKSYSYTFQLCNADWSP